MAQAPLRQSRLQPATQAVRRPPPMPRAPRQRRRGRQERRLLQRQAQQEQPRPREQRQQAAQTLPGPTPRAAPAGAAAVSRGMAACACAAACPPSSSAGGVWAFFICSGAVCGWERLFDVFTGGLAGRGQLAGHVPLQIQQVRLGCGAQAGAISTAVLFRWKGLVLLTLCTPWEVGSPLCKLASLSVHLAPQPHLPPGPA